MRLKRSPRARILLALLFSSSLLIASAPDHPAYTQTSEQRARTVAAPAPAQTPAQLPTPTPQPTPQVLPAAPAPRTVEELRARIQAVLAQPQLAPAMLGVKVTSLDTGRVLFAANEGKLLMPASNMKLYTVAAALDRLGPDFRFVTSIYANGRPDKTGRVRGDLTVYGR
ncbi:MAG TPA: D-alanyl-D-alanine carboxypeptidase, partial [Pyrinomonadaceae bacterium]|nr:D-alanyl-D-alanine carboxypeptidase [Pyrinomonadaceae bacterium]